MIAEYSEIKTLADAMAAAVKPQRIYLFGSFAKGLQNEHSDYDFYIVMDDATYSSDVVLKARKALWGKRKRPVDVLVSSEERFNANKSEMFSVERDVATEGVVVYG